MYLSDFIKNGTQLQAPAGALAIAANDLVAIAANQLFSCQVADFAAVPNQGSQVFPSTAVSGFIAANMRNSIYYNAADATIFAVTPYLSTNNGVKVFKYFANGLLYNSQIIDSSAVTTVTPSIVKLSNGNYAVIWQASAGNAYFAIIDQYLNILVAKTAIDAVDTTQSNFHAIALSGGGFAIAYSKSNPFLAVYDNTGAVVRAGAALTNAAIFTVSVSVSLVQLANGNIAIGIASGNTSKAIGHAITTATGANVVQCTMLDSGTSASVQRVSMSALANNYCIGVMSGSRVAAYVLSNAGAVQGAEFTDSSGGGGASPDLKVLNDGALFWMIYDDASNIVAITALPLTGTGYNTTTFATGTTHQSLDAVIEHGLLVFCTASVMYVIQLNGAANACYLVNSFNADAGRGGLKLLTDFSLIGWSSTNLVGYKYLNASIAGVAQQGVAAGNAGAAINFTMGPGAYVCNALAGTVGKAFDHTTANIAANKGTMLGSSVSLKGI
jgi:hypothetical protein